MSVTQWREGRLWIVNLTAGGVGLGFDAVGPRGAFGLSLRPAGWGLRVTQWAEGCLWIVKLTAGGVGLGFDGMARGTEGRFWVPNFAASGVGLGCDAMVRGLPLGYQIYGRRGGTRLRRKGPRVASGLSS